MFPHQPGSSASFEDVRVSFSVIILIQHPIQVFLWLLNFFWKISMIYLIYQFMAMISLTCWLNIQYLFVDIIINKHTHVTLAVTHSLQTDITYHLYLPLYRAEGKLPNKWGHRQFSQCSNITETLVYKIYLQYLHPLLYEKNLTYFTAQHPTAKPFSLIRMLA